MKMCHWLQPNIVVYERDCKENHSQNYPLNHYSACRNNVRRRSGVFTVNFEHISHCFIVYFVDFEQINAGKATASSKFLL